MKDVASSAATLPEKDCLALLAILATGGGEAAAGRASAAIDRFAAMHRPRRRRAELRRLYADFVALALDSSTALAIETDLRRRVSPQARDDPRIRPEIHGAS